MSGLENGTLMCDGFVRISSDPETGKIIYVSASPL